jgi:hypothetical protein
MVTSSRLLVALSLAGLFHAPLAADVIPAQYGTASPAKAEVRTRLTGMGVDAESARERTARLTPDEAAYFAVTPERVQVVGQEPFGGQSNNMWYEWLFGLAALAGGVAVLVWFGVSND